MTRKKKESYLLDAGLMKIVDGEIMLSSEAIAILSDTRPEEWEEIAKKHGTDVANIPHAFAQKVRRGAKEVQAKFGTDDFVEILYAKAVR